jgi:outer membrane murein-binding lipoprotein Lpp
MSQRKPTAKKDEVQPQIEELRARIKNMEAQLQAIGAAVQAIEDTPPEPTWADWWRSIL